VYGNVIMQDPQ